MEIREKRPFPDSYDYRSIPVLWYSNNSIGLLTQTGIQRLAAVVKERRGSHESAKTDFPYSHIPDALSAAGISDGLR